jgi:hypothetical protein
MDTPLRHQRIPEQQRGRRIRNNGEAPRGINTDFHLENGVTLQAGDTVKLVTIAEVVSSETGRANKSGTIARETIFVKPINTKASYLGQNGPARPAE